MLKKIGIGVGVIVVGLLAFIATRPDVSVYKRSLAMTAPPEVIYAAVNDFHRWQDWSPWEKLDPSMTKKYDGPATGNGAIYTWKGTGDVGEGRMTNLGGKPNEHIDIKLEFMAPMEATNETTFDFKSAGTGTEVTWTMTAHNGFMGKAFGVFMDMEKMLGDQFDKGLAQLKTVADADNAKAMEAKKAAEEAARKLAEEAAKKALEAAALAAPPAAAPAKAAK